MGAANVSMNMQDNPYVPFPSKILEVIRHTQKEYTFRMEFVGDVKPGQFFEVSMPKYGEAPISVSGIGENFVDLTIRKVGRVTGEVFEKYEGQSLLMRGPYGNGFDVSLYEDGEVIVVAGGTGVSPVRGVIEALSLTKDAKDKHVIVGFKSPDDMLFRSDLKNWADRLDLILTVDGAPEGYEGNIGLSKFIRADPRRRKRHRLSSSAPRRCASVMGLLRRASRKHLGLPGARCAAASANADTAASAKNTSALTALFSTSTPSART